MRTILASIILGLATPIKISKAIVGGHVGDSCSSDRDCLVGLECDSGFCAANDFIIPEIIPDEPSVEEPLDLSVVFVGGDLIAGGWSEEQEPDEYEIDILLDDDFLETLEDKINRIMRDVEIESIRTQVVAGTNYLVKYSYTNAGRRRYILSQIFEPLPFTGEGLSVTSWSDTKVTFDSEIPAGLC